LADGTNSLGRIVDLLGEREPSENEDGVARDMLESVGLLMESRLIVFFSGGLDAGEVPQ
jgi:asparagine synthetase B (glutamine-hydrolysing)